MTKSREELNNLGYVKGRRASDLESINGIDPMPIPRDVLDKAFPPFELPEKKTNV